MGRCWRPATVSSSTPSSIAGCCRCPPTSSMLRCSSPSACWPSASPRYAGWSASTPGSTSGPAPSPGASAAGSSPAPQTRGDSPWNRVATALEAVGEGPPLKEEEELPPYREVLNYENLVEFYPIQFKRAPHKGAYRQGE